MITKLYLIPFIKKILDISRASTFWEKSMEIILEYYNFEIIIIEDILYVTSRLYLIEEN
jgi:hypothetical protein